MRGQTACDANQMQDVLRRNKAGLRNGQRDAPPAT